MYPSEFLKGWRPFAHAGAPSQTSGVRRYAACRRTQDLPIAVTNTPHPFLCDATTRECDFPEFGVLSTPVAADVFGDPSPPVSPRLRKEGARRWGNHTKLPAQAARPAPQGVRVRDCVPPTGRHRLCPRRDVAGAAVPTRRAPPQGGDHTTYSPRRHHARRARCISGRQPSRPRRAAEKRREEITPETSRVELSIAGKPDEHRALTSTTTTRWRIRGEQHGLASCARSRLSLRSSIGQICTLATRPRPRA